MPRKLERKLRQTARRKGLTAKATSKYVYGGLRRAGWKPKRHKAPREHFLQ